MTTLELLTTMFGSKLELEQTNNILTGYADYKECKFALLGVINHAMLDNQMALDLADFILWQIKSKTVTNLLIILDTGGQQVTHNAELLGINRYFAHLIKTLHYAKLNGMTINALISGGALGGAFIATALNATKIYALKEAQIAVMWLEAMAKITKIPLTTLQELGQASCIFAPGVENFYKLGVLEKIVTIEEFMPELMGNLNTKIPNWFDQGYERGGRQYASSIITEILHA